MACRSIAGYGNAKDLPLTREAGFGAHLLEPVDLEDVEDLLASWNPIPAA